MEVYRSKHGLLNTTSNSEAKRSARKAYRTVQKRTPRRIPYVRSIYFSKDKIFINQFWNHLNQKNRADQTRRLAYYVCALDLIRNTKHAPATVFEADKNIILHRFQGITVNGDYFVVQIKQNKKTNRKEFMSVFPAKIDK